MAKTRIICVTEDNREYPEGLIAFRDWINEKISLIPSEFLDSAFIVFDSDNAYNTCLNIYYHEVMDDTYEEDTPYFTALKKKLGI